MKMKNDELKDLEDIVEVKELKLVVDVNAHINLGWKLLATYKTTSQNNNQTIKYCVGKPKTAGALNQAKRKPDIVKTRADKDKKFVYSL